jgi:hypothetical protein
MIALRTSENLLCLGRPSLKQKNPPQNHWRKQQDCRCSFIATFSYHPGDLEFHHSIETKANIISITFQDTGENSSGESSLPKSF